jgi:ribonucleoside-diphosphate reductase alpha chain
MISHGPPAFVIDSSRFPLPQQAENARGSRRIGLGITGLADALVMLGLTYGSEEPLALAGQVLRVICHAAYRAFIRSLPEDIQDAIARTGIRNSHLLAIAPTGTISLLAGNVSSGLEPIFAPSYARNVLEEDGAPKQFMLTDYALDLWRQLTGSQTGLPPAFITAGELLVTAHIRMQAAL